jgi:hypothetical protein
MPSLRYTTLGLTLVSMACNPQTDLQGQQATSVPSDGAAALPSGATVAPETGVLVDPPPGSTGLATNLAAIVVRFTEPVMAVGQGTPFVLQAEDGVALPMALGPQVACAGSCYQLVPQTSLADATLYALMVEPGALQFLDGKPVAGGKAGAFATGTGADLYVPRIQAFAIEASEGCLAVHATVDEYVRVEVQLVSDATTTSIGSDGFAAGVDFAARAAELPAGALVQATLRAVDRSGNVATSLPIAVQLPPVLPPLVITEVLANPAGSETTQELVEIYNAGSEAIGLGGIQIADKTGSDTLPEAILPAGGYAVIVGDKFDPTDGKDPPPRDSALLIHVSGRIGSDGLSNAGETVRLLTASGCVISQYGGWIDVNASAWSGKSVKRVSVDACDGPTAWSNTPSAPTPGW